MSLANKLKDYFKENGLQKKWFAEKLGMSKQQLYQVIGGYAPLPRKHWKNIIIMTGGKITLVDLMQECLSSIEEIEIKSDGSVDKCQVSLKDFNTVT